MSLFTLDTFEINSAAELRVGSLSDGLAEFRWLGFVCVHHLQLNSVWFVWLRVKRGSVAANPGAIFEEDTVTRAKKVL